MIKTDCIHICCCISNVYAIINIILNKLIHLSFDRFTWLSLCQKRKYIGTHCEIRTRLAPLPIVPPTGILNISRIIILYQSSEIFLFQVIYFDFCEAFAPRAAREGGGRVGHGGAPHGLAARGAAARVLQGRVGRRLKPQAARRGHAA